MVLFCSLVLIAASVLHVAGRFSINDTTYAAKDSLLLQLFELNPDLAPDSTPVNPPDYMKELYLKVSDENGSVTHPGAIQGNHVHSFLERGHVKSKLFFNVSSILHAEEQILYVELVLFKLYSPSKLKFPKPLSIAVEIIDAFTGAIVSVQLVPSYKVGWQTFPVGLRLVENWLRNQSTNDGLVVRVRRPSMDVKARNPYSLRFARGEGKMKNKQPMFVVYCNDPTLGQKQPPSRNSTANIGHGNNYVVRRSERAIGNSACRRHKMFVDFKAMGWHSWVIAPKYYSAFYCSGRCSHPINSGQLSPSTHALIQAQLVFQARNSDIAEPCCVPMQMSAISLMYYDKKDKKSITYKLLSDMVVERCACR